MCWGPQGSHWLVLTSGGNSLLRRRSSDALPRAGALQALLLPYCAGWHLGCEGALLRERRSQEAGFYKEETESFYDEGLSVSVGSRCHGVGEGNNFGMGQALTGASPAIH